MAKQDETIYDASSAGTYIATRLDKQVGWYDHKSGSLKRRYRFLKILTIAISALIPVTIALSSVENDRWNFLKYGAAILGALVTVLEGVSGLLKDKETFIGYRAASEGLIREKMKFQSNSGDDYAGSDDENFKKLVANCEAIMAGENSKWMTTFTQESSSSSQAGGDGKS
jgi:hypothetical protein